MARSSAARAGRTLVVFFLGMAILYGLVAIAGSWKPALGLDLEGGARITLQAQGSPDEDSLEEARKIIDQRVNGSGVAEADVTVQGGRFVVVEVPGDVENRRQLEETVKRQAQLRFRLVACSDSDGRCAAGAAGAPGDGSVLEPGAVDPGAVVPPADGGAEPPAGSNRPPVGFAQADETPAPSDEPAPADPAATPAEAPEGSTPADPSASAPPTPQVVEYDGPKAGETEELLAWQNSPDQASIDAFNAFTCPTDGTPATLVDDPERPIVSCEFNEEAGASEKMLLSAAVVEGTDLKDASYGTPQQGTGWVVTLSIGGAGENAFEKVSRALLPTEQRFAIVLDGQVVTALGFDGVIPNGEAQISGDFTEAEADSLATSLRFGALPIAFDRDVTVEDIGPSLAGDQLSAGMWAGAIGLGLVMIYCLLYYRGLGLVVFGSLAVAAGISYALVLLLSETAGFTLTLPGIAGFIIAVGVTADSFILFFERIRDEMREGKSMRVAVETGWKRAKVTRLAANVVSLLSAAVLYIFATGVVKGFGFALGLSTLIDLAVLFWFTKPLVSYLARFRFFNGGGKLSGLSKETLGMDAAPAGGKA
ncbi:protein translocase subunit SecD [Nocardioides sp. W7]|uniref:protein translocase subunit SecD n=1 Tax=Nocardioides sp. W7 TaxID=2931390 RepID=UPI001FD0801C|nr:protein translocase subunit SecD [Nocardioides sp. W7]